MLKREKWPIPAYIEYEYRGAATSIRGGQKVLPVREADPRLDAERPAGRGTGECNRLVAAGARAFEPEIHEDRRSDCGAPGADAAGRARRRSRSRHRGLDSFAHELGVDAIQLSAAFHPAEADVPAEAMLDPVANTLDLRRPFDAAAGPPRRARARSHRSGAVGHRLLRQHAASRSGDSREEACVHAARLRRRRAARRRRGLRVRRPQRCAHDGPEPAGLRGAVRSAARRREGARSDLSGRAVPDAGMDDGRQLSQQHRLHARERGSRCIASARSTASATSSVFTTIRRTPS